MNKAKINANAANSITAIIADDEQHLANYLVQKLNSLWPELNIVGVAKNGSEALALIQELRPSVAFLDIQMPGLTGIDVVSQLGTTNKKPHIVFVTAFDHYAVKAFEHRAVDYLLKPVTDARLLLCIEQLKQKLNSSQAAPDLQQLLQHIAQLQAQTQTHIQPEKPTYLRWIRASFKEVTRQIPIDEILYFQSQDKYIVVMTKSGESLIRTPLAELISQLDPEHFWQVHRSTVVNVNKISASYRNVMGNIVLNLHDSENELIVSRAYHHLFKQM
jgi:DNA-binding LytR/AlgR family response regulator